MVLIVLPSAVRLLAILIMPVLRTPTWVMPGVRPPTLIVFTQTLYLRLKQVVVAVKVILRRLVLALVTIPPPFTHPVSSVLFT